MPFLVKQRDQIAKGTGKRQGDVEQSAGAAAKVDACIPDYATCACGGTCPACKSGTVMQAKLKLNVSGDKFEHEADRIADEVIASESGYPVSGSAATYISEVTATESPQIQRELIPASENDGDVDQIEPVANEDAAIIIAAISEYVGEADEVSGVVQAKTKTDESGDVFHHSPSGLGRLPSGEALPEASLKYFSRNMGVDFSKVRIHRGALAAELASSIDARAFTLGNSIVFNKGEYSPSTREGRYLLAHELTHVLQQSAGEVGCIQRQRRPGRSGASSSIPGTTSSKSLLFFSDMNAAIQSMAGRVSNLSLSDYTVLAPDRYVAHVASSTLTNIKSEYTSALAIAKQACGAPLAQIAKTSKELRKLKAFRADRRFCRGSQPTNLAISIWLSMRGYTPPGGGRSVIIQETSLDKTLFLMLHEGIHRMQGAEWRGRSMPTRGGRQHSIHTMTRLSPLSEAVDEGATQILTLEVIKTMQGIAGRNWFSGFATSAYSQEVKRVQKILSDYGKNINFLKTAYFSNTSYREVEDIQLWQ